jgi:hypothetical protein
VDLTIYASSKRSMVFAAIENIVTDHTSGYSPNDSLGKDE